MCSSFVVFFDERKDMVIFLKVNLKAYFLKNNCEGKKTTNNKKKKKTQSQGQERFRQITSAYYRGAHGVILVYDITQKSSFEHVQDWLDEVHKCTGDNVIKLVVGNKADLIELREVEETVAQAYAQRVNSSFVETSAKTASNVDKAFLTIAQQLVASRYFFVFVFVLQM
ncbi:GTP-binding protein YPTM1 [Reticulomyxa filosa]|uniref:GTP-binding protein YPTM1 n=1 Tax=Reticulomyxa filosa TaxID=46433 RepID=X6LPT0_RETFI|nr:GTP-binding protein YPTM1 [Reticulomyxa filosa]|eukprot:ETO03361.1 GTP-binding protein YPTM1 [Reticulomyxa filosa]